MFAEFLNIIVRSLKLDKTLYKDNRNFGEAAIYFAGLIMILDGVAGAVAANTFVKTSIGISGDFGVGSSSPIPVGSKSSRASVCKSRSRFARMISRGEVGRYSL